MSEEERIQLIDNYLSGLLTPEEREAFDERLLTDPAWKAEVAWQRSTVEGLMHYFDSRIDQLQINQLASRLANEEWAFDPSMQEETTPEITTENEEAFRLKMQMLFFEDDLGDDKERGGISDIPKDKVTGYVGQKVVSDARESAEKLLFDVMVLMSTMASKPYSFKPYPFLLGNVPEGVEPLYEQASEKFYTEEASKLFAQVAQILSSSVTDANNPGDFEFYYGLSLTYSTDVRKGIEVLEKVRQSSTHRFSHQAAWYLAFAYLKIYDRDRSRLYLEQLSVQAGEFQNPAKQLLQELYPTGKP